MGVRDLRRLWLPFYDSEVRRIPHPDNESLLRKQVLRLKVSLAEALNHFLGLGISLTERRGGFLVTPRKPGLPTKLTYDSVEQLQEAIEGHEHR